MEYVVQLITAYAGSLGYALLFQIQKDKLFVASFGGFLSWGIYLLSEFAVSGDVKRYFIATIGLTIYAEIMAYVKKTPTTIFLVSGAIPLIPGGSLYQTMCYAVGQEWEHFTIQGRNTLLLALAIALGIICTMSCLQVWKAVESYIIRRWKMAPFK